MENQKSENQNPKHNRPAVASKVSPLSIRGDKGGSDSAVLDRENTIENSMGNLLRVGVLTAGAVVLLGGIYYLLAHGSEQPEFHIFKGESSDVTSFSGIFRGLFDYSPRAWIQFGLLLLIATPVARVLFALVVFLREKDRKFTLITLLVLVFLLYGFLGGKV
jgi:uncharacterized membrane protein